MSIREYHRKRDFKKTPEPKTSASPLRKTKKPIFIVQKHAASHLHYDFRLEMDGVLKSWAVPKGPSLDPADKRLAMHVEDHPLSYATFEGIIPKGQYGGGTVMLWDRGTWKALGDAKKSYQKGKLDFILSGKKLKGQWHLVRMKVDEQGKTPWLLIKSHDDQSRSTKEYNILLEEDSSVSTQRSLEQIADHAPSSRKSVKKSTKSLPLIKPQLATLVNKAPKGKDWLYEVKYDGYRFLAYFTNAKVKLITRNGLNWTQKVSKIQSALEKLTLENTVLDGELVAIDKKGQISFQQLQNFLSEGEATKLIYYIFDIPFYQGKDIRKIALLERKKLLAKLLKKAPAGISYADHIIGNGDKVWKEACRLKYEGIIAKKTDCIYESKRTKTWLKLKCLQEKEFLIIGYTQSQHRERGFASLVLGYYDNKKKLHYAGNVGTGFNQATIQQLLKQLNEIKSKTANFKTIPKEINNKITVWVRPELVAKVRFIERTATGLLRHPSFIGLKTMAEPSAPKNNKFTNVDKIIFDEPKITKGDLAHYYEELGEWILPHIINRPLMILRCPHGQNHTCFFQKHYRDKLPKGLYVKSIKEKHGPNPYIYIKDSAGLLALSQLAMIEIHPWGSNNTTIEKPDRITFDLDPAPNVPWKQVILAAKRLRAYLLKYKLESFVKTSGKKGLHIVVPLTPHSNWAIIKEFSKSIADDMVENYPNEYIATMSKAKRSGKIFIDYFRNGRGSTSVAPYSCRANDTASVSLPISWSELSKIKSADQYDINDVMKKYNKLKKDPWENFFKLRQKI